MKIGIFDSGLGGLIVTQAIHKAMPKYDYVYLGDTKRVPYGDKSQETIYEYAREVIDYLFREEDCAIVLVACNTVSARALREIQQDYLPKNYKDRKVLGVLIPSAEVASHYEKVGIIATSSTVASETFPLEIKKLNSNTEVFQNPAPRLVPLIEEGDEKNAKIFLSEYLRPLLNKKMGALVLGCTHYPILKREIKKIVGENVKIISQDEIIPKKFKEYLEQHKEIDRKLSKNRSIQILVTKKTKNMDRLIKRWLNELGHKTNKRDDYRFNVVLDVVNDLSVKHYEKINKKDLEKEILSIVETLKKDGKSRLAQCVEKNWNKTAIEYSKELNTYEPSKPMEKELLLGFKKELERLDTAPSQKTEILTSLQKIRVLQTTHHVVPAEGPRIFCADWLGSLGVLEKEFYVVGMFSGIPFSNNFRPGRIEGRESKVNLFPSSMQDALVYKSKIPTKMPEEIKNLPEELRKILPDALPDNSYTKWAIQTCQEIQRKVLNKKNFIYIDINEVIATYLIQVLEKKSHPLHKLFFDDKTRNNFLSTFKNEIIFYAPIQNGKYEEMENLFFERNIIKGKNREISLKKPETLINDLQEGKLCPSLFLTYTTLSFLNEFKCFGSFAQIEHLPAYQEKLKNLDLMKNFNILKIPTANLTIGKFQNEEEFFPVDLIIKKKNFKYDENCLFGELLIGMKDRLLENYVVNKKL